MILWSGLGILTVLFALGGAMLGSALHGLIPALSDQVGVAIGLLAAAAVNWWVGFRLNSRPGRELIDPKTGGRVMLRRRHTLFWLPMQYYSVLFLLVAVVALFAPAHRVGGA
ncbi:hypothetical protein [Bradyrhizobium commune]|uniref:Uncharacterized protein n=1 Tax=Bradyrhizobium commune TaxID=83627 RepID=A0A7S9D7E1_9BRAD|nr:hypothetical protein [Bradyrhizobium commune]QPF92589.1 hypothetical protein IC761_04700 [Bradyrhizobium commune]